MKRQIHLALLLLALLLSQPGYSQDKLTNNLLERIEASEKALETTSRNINREKRAYAEKLGGVEREVIRLREQAAGIQREADEQLLSLENIQARLDKWRDQQDYQNHLLQRHAELLREGTSELAGASGTKILERSVGRLDTLLDPRWKSTEVAMPSGEFAMAQTIAFGPARWFLVPETGQAGLFEASPGDHLRSYYMFEGNARDSLRHLLTGGAGSPLFDPTQGRAIEIARHQESFWAHLEKGGFWIFPIIFFGAVSLIIAVLKAVQFTRLPRSSQYTVDKLEKLLSADTRAGQLADRLLRDRPNAYTRIVQIIRQHPPSQKRDDLLFAHLNDQRRQTDKYLGIISLTAAVAPLLGLLGTVSGMIKTFKMLTIFGSGDPAAVSGGISEALVTTELGLIVAIPALVISAFLSRRAKGYIHDLEETAVALNTHNT